MERFCQFPTCKDFSLASNEEVKLVIRRHWINNYLILIQWIFWGPLFFILSLWLFSHFHGEWNSGLSLFIFSGKILYLMFVTFWYYIKWINDTFDIIFLTNDRVLDITQEDLWHRNIIETRLDHVQDATGDIKGFFNTLFDWGEIRIRTANDKADFSIDMIDNAHKKAREVFRLANLARKKEISGIAEIKEGEFCPVDFSGYKKKIQKKENPHSKNNKNHEKKSEKHTLSFHDIKQDLRNNLNKIMSQKKK